MPKPVLILILGLMSGFAWAQEMELEREPVGREPAGVVLPTSSAKRTYPGGADEEDLRVQSALPEVVTRTDARGIQKEVFKNMYNQDLKDETNAPMEE